MWRFLTYEMDIHTVTDKKVHLTINFLILKSFKLTVLKIYIHHIQLDLLSENLGVVNDERGERYVQDVSFIEKYYHTKWRRVTLVQYCRKLHIRSIHKS